MGSFPGDNLPANAMVSNYIPRSLVRAADFPVELVMLLRETAAVENLRRHSCVQ
jgi:hypothetical protein